MKIDETLSGANQVNSLNRAQTASEVSSVSEGKPEGKPEGGSKAGLGTGDSATLGAGAALASHLANVSDARMEKVASVQQALAAGTYRVDAGQVADKIIASMLQKQS